MGDDCITFEPHSIHRQWFSEGVSSSDDDLNHFCNACRPCRTDDRLVGTEVPAAFTEQGAAAFGTYVAGEALDPVSFTVVLPADCGLEAAPAAKPVADTDDVDAEASAASTAGPMPWLVWAGIALVVLLLGAAVSIVLIRRGRRSA